jgi:hypothetical protein
VDSLTAAAFARFPFITITELRWYAGVDVLLLFALAHDLGRVRAPFDSSNFRSGGSTVQPGRIALNDAVLV